MSEHCDVGGDWTQTERGSHYREPCPTPPTHRWRTDQMVEGHWNYRCTPHVAWLQRDLPGLVIEELKR